MKSFENVLDDLSEKFSKDLAGCAFQNLNDYYRKAYNKDRVLIAISMPLPDLPPHIADAVGAAFSEFSPTVTEFPPNLCE